MQTSLFSFLSTKPLYYAKIDHERVHHAYALLSAQIKTPPAIHIVGTNAKGSTGRILAHLVQKQKNQICSVGHYTSPHILVFNERIWIDGENASNEVLEAAHKKLFALLGEEISESLSYFEYTTLLAFVVFENCDLIVLEAGLGGEFDASNVCDKVLSIITPIGIDHQAFLGDTIEEIAGTKIRSIQTKALLAPQIFDEVVDVARKIASLKSTEIFLSEELGLKNKELKTICKNKGWSDYLVENATVASQALDILDIKYNVEDLLDLELFGRFYLWRKNIRIDVGHNPLAAKVIEQALDEKVILIYNSLDDKDYEKVLRILKPKVKHVEIIQIQSQRASTTEEIERTVENVGLECRDFQNKLEDDEDYLVFGSFYVVEAFLKKMDVNVSK